MQEPQFNIAEVEEVPMESDEEILAGFPEVEDEPLTYTEIPGYSFC